MYRIYIFSKKKKSNQNKCDLTSDNIPYVLWLRIFQVFIHCPLDNISKYHITCTRHFSTSCTDLTHSNFDHEVNSVCFICLVWRCCFCLSLAFQFIRTKKVYDLSFEKLKTLYDLYCLQSTALTLTDFTDNNPYKQRNLMFVTQIHRQSNYICFKPFQCKMFEKPTLRKTNEIFGF